MSYAESAGRLSQTLKIHNYQLYMDTAVKQNIELCTTCSKSKRGTRVYGETDPRDASEMPWQEAHCDSIGPWKIELRAKTLTFHAMTMINACTSLA